MPKIESMEYIYIYQWNIYGKNWFGKKCAKDEKRKK